MRHIRTYNESSGQTWRRVGEDEMARHMRGQEVDTFAKGEVKEIVDLIIPKLGWEVREVHVPTLARTGRLEIEMFDEEVQPLRKFFTDSDGRPSHDIDNSRKPSNHVIVCDMTQVAPNVLFMGVPMTKNVWHEIFKSTDDYFYVCTSDPTEDDVYHICDGLVGVKSLLGEFIEGRYRGRARRR
jgi:hypothetical protein